MMTVVLSLSPFDRLRVTGSIVMLSLSKHQGDKA
jgi:hypothetical protein